MFFPSVAAVNVHAEQGVEVDGVMTAVQMKPNLDSPAYSGIDAYENALQYKPKIKPSVGGSFPLG